MRHLRHQARLPLLLGLLAFLVASTGALLHDILVQHEVCDEHGEVVEIDPNADADEDHGDEDEHDHDCSFEGLATLATSELPTVDLPRADLPPHAAPDLTAAAPRGPPLAFAPKTSPPASA